MLQNNQTNLDEQIKSSLRKANFVISHTYWDACDLITNDSTDEDMRRIELIKKFKEETQKNLDQLFIEMNF